MVVRHLLMVILALGLISCGIFESAESKQTKICVADVKLGLNDPNSLEVLSVEHIDMENGWHRLKLEFTAKNALGGRVRANTICGFKSKRDTELNQDDFMNKNRKLARDLRQLGIDLK